MEKIDQVLIFDLDGTILTVNSFPFWVLYMLGGRFDMSVNDRATLSFRTAQIMARRKLLREDHGITKQKLAALWAQALAKDPAAQNRLIGKLLSYRRRNLWEALALVKEDKADALLSTSAAQSYAHALGHELGFKHILATEPKKPENRSEEKRNGTLAKLQALGWDKRKRIFFTDHEEDLPLIRECDVTLWFGDDDEAKAMCEQSGKEVIPCRNEPADQLERILLYIESRPAV